MNFGSFQIFLLSVTAPDAPEQMENCPASTPCKRMFDLLPWSGSFGFRKLQLKYLLYFHQYNFSYPEVRTMFKRFSTFSLGKCKKTLDSTWAYYTNEKFSFRNICSFIVCCHFFWVITVWMAKYLENREDFQMFLCQIQSTHSIGKDPKS